MGRGALLLLVVALVALSFAPTVAAFGAGNIPSFSYLEDKAFRHGDIEDIISTLAKASGGGFLGRSTKFTGLDVKRIYFGNWARDYSQAVDVAALKKTNLQTILNVCMVYVTGEFEVTKESLGCYLPVEHIDNPKGYAEGEDARQYDPRLRPPVQDIELEIDPHTGMKNYIANERGNWDTSSALVRRVLFQCIEAGRRFRQTRDENDSFVAFQLLGRALHTLEDFTAHSNWCELTLATFGYHQVFAHVGRNVKIRAPNGKDVPPLVTGSFGGADFIHSIMGEAGDKLSSSAVSDVSRSMENARSASDGQSSAISTLMQIFTQLPSGDGQQLSREMNDISSMRAGQPGGVDPSQMSAQELHANLWRVLSFRDSVMKRIENTIEKIPGLSSLTEKVSNSVAVFVITTIEPYVKPLLGTATEALANTSQEVISSHDQEIVWNDWNCSDPTHSFLSKDHFDDILNEPAGEVAKVIVEYAVNSVVKAWDDPSIDPRHVTDSILECLHHPDFRNPHSQIQTLMAEKMRQWIDGTGSQRNTIINLLTSDNVRAHKNKRLGDHSQATGHVHNSMLPEGGLQGALASQKIHVPGANILNAGQDLMSGKMPWQQGFGSGGPNAWREMDVNEQHPTRPPPPLEQLEQYSQGHSHSHSHSHSGGGGGGGYAQDTAYGGPGGNYGGGAASDFYGGGGQPQQYQQQYQGGNNYSGGGGGYQQQGYQQQGYQQQDQYGGGGGGGQYGQFPPPPQQYQQNQQQGGWGQAPPPPHHQQYGGGGGGGYQSGPPGGWR